jgi:hypothetical protein
MPPKFRNSLPEPQRLAAAHSNAEKLNNKNAASRGREAIQLRKRADNKSLNEIRLEYCRKLRANVSELISETLSLLAELKYAIPSSFYYLLDYLLDSLSKRGAGAGPCRCL